MLYTLYACLAHQPPGRARTGVARAVVATALRGYRADRLSRPLLPGRSVHGHLGAEVGAGRPLEVFPRALLRSDRQKQDRVKCQVVSDRATAHPVVSQ